jgi:adenosylhomocysteine nucleosidase
MIGLMMATMLEAEPFISGLDLKQLETQPFRIYGKGDLILILSGIGKANASIAATYFIQRFNPSCLCNLGAAGAVDSGFSLGECFHVGHIIEPDRPDLRTDLPQEHIPDILDGFSTRTLATQDRPIREAAEREAVAVRKANLVDMEGAAFAQTCRRLARPGYLFKFVSDTPDHTTSNDIIANIALYRDAFFRFFQNEVLFRLKENSH